MRIKIETKVSFSSKFQEFIPRRYYYTHHMKLLQDFDEEREALKF